MVEKVQLVLCSHGKYCEELKRSAEMICGSMKNVVSFCLMPGESTDEYIAKMKTYLDSNGSTQKYLFLVDLFGGTPCNCARILARNYFIDIVTGMNLACLIETYSAINESLDANYTDLAYQTVIKSAYEILKDGEGKNGGN